MTTRLHRSLRLLPGIFCAIIGTVLLAGAFALGHPNAVHPVVVRADPSEEAAESSAMQARVVHLTKVGVKHWHSRGFSGKGVKVAVLDSGFRGWRDHLGESLPQYVTAKSFRADGNLEARDSQHGILCGEVVHALAPDAELLFANWESDDPERFLDAVRWAREQGAKVITCSIIMPSWGDGEGGGPVHKELTRILGADKADDMLFFASAGNTANRSWSGTFCPGTDGFHEWKKGMTSNPLMPWGTDRVSVEVCWKANADFEIQVIDADTGREVVSSVRRDQERHSVQARFEPEKGRSYRVRVREVRGEPCVFHCVALASGMEYFNPAGSICFPADGPEVVAVGAVDSDGKRMNYSSCGPNSKATKPDLMATVPFPSLFRDRPFSGTSAASPQAAALAALWRGRHPDWSAAKVRQAMNSSARDLGEPGVDLETGHGLIRLPEE